MVDLLLAPVERAGFTRHGSLVQSQSRHSKIRGLEFLWERPMTLALVILGLVLLVAPYLVDKLKIRDRFDVEIVH